MKSKSDNWLRNGLLNASVARPFLPSFLPYATTLPRKWRRGRGRATQGYSDASTIQSLKSETPRNHSIASTYVAILHMPTELRLIRAYLGCGYGRPRQQLRAYYCYGYGRTTSTATGILRLRLHTTSTAMGILQLRLRVNVQACYVNFFTAYTVYCIYSFSPVATFKLCGYKACTSYTSLHNTDNFVTISHINLILSRCIDLPFPCILMWPTN